MSTDEGLGPGLDLDDLFSLGLDDDDEPEEDQPACCLCLKPAGRVPLRCWYTSDEQGEEVLDEWVVCWRCVEKSGKPLPELLRELGESALQRHRGSNV